jgi:hypothetical protein
MSTPTDPVAVAPCTLSPAGNGQGPHASNRAGPRVGLPHCLRAGGWLDRCFKGRRDHARRVGPARGVWTSHLPRTLALIRANRWTVRSLSLDLDQPVSVHNVDNFSPTSST